MLLRFLLPQLFILFSSSFSAAASFILLSSITCNTLLRQDCVTGDRRCCKTMMLWRRPPPLLLLKNRSTPLRATSALCFRYFCSSSVPGEPSPEEPKRAPLKPGLYLVGTPIGNLEDITLRALRVLQSADLILCEDTRHSWKLLRHYDIKTPLLSYHKFNESQREQMVLRRLKQGEVVALISDAGMPGICDPGTELAKLCIKEDVTVIPIPGPSSFVAALSASGLTTDEFTFVGFLSKHTGSRKERLMISASDSKTQIFYVPPHKLQLFLEETSSIFGDSRQCVIAREITKLHEEFWRGSLGEAKQVFSTHQPKGEITLLIEGKANSEIEMPSEIQLENELRHLISTGHSLSMAVKLVSQGTSTKRKTVYSLALQKFGKELQDKDG